MSRAFMTIPLPKTFRAMGARGMGIGPFVICRSDPKKAHEYWAGGGITRRRQRWVFDPHQAFGFAVKSQAVDMLRRLKERDGRVDDLRMVVTD